MDFIYTQRKWAMTVTCQMTINSSTSAICGSKARKKQGRRIKGRGKGLQSQLFSDRLCQAFEKGLFWWKSDLLVSKQCSGGASGWDGHCLRRFLMIWLLRIHIFSDEGRLPLVCWDFRQPKTYLGSSHVSLCIIGGSVGQFNKNGRVNNTHNLQHFYKNSNQQIWERHNHKGWWC